MTDIGQAVTVSGRHGTTVNHESHDTFPTLAGKYHPTHPGCRQWHLVRWDDWPDDEWVPAHLVTADA
jgi:hypothetical protein